MSTLPPTPQFNANIPIISSAGGTAVAYKDPKSPESIMKKTTLLEAQGAVDTMYDVDLKKEGFRSSRFSRNRKFSGSLYTMYSFILLLLIALFTQKKRAGKMYIALLASVLLIITIWNIRGWD
jgi:membrane-bound metal-dependent hydrolase YbcI (DUF457 family)